LGHDFEEKTRFLGLTRAILGYLWLNVAT